MLSGLRAPEILIILVVLVLLFGAKKLPDLSRSLGRSMRIFKSEVKAMKNDDDDPAPSAEAKPIQAPVVRPETPEAGRQSVPEAERREP